MLSHCVHEGSVWREFFCFACTSCLAAKLMFWLLFQFSGGGRTTSSANQLGCTDVPVSWSTTSVDSNSILVKIIKSQTLSFPKGLQQLVDLHGNPDGQSRVAWKCFGEWECVIQHACTAWFTCTWWIGSLLTQQGWVRLCRWVRNWV